MQSLVTGLRHCDWGLLCFYTVIIFTTIQPKCSYKTAAHLPHSSHDMLHWLSQS